MADLIHVMPTNDIKEHEESPACWCNPKVEYYEISGICVHNALSKDYPEHERITEQ